MKKLILASQSPRRQALLAQLAVPFVVEVSGVDEQHDQSLSAEELVLTLATAKAEAVASRHLDAIVIGADTMVHFQGQLFGKPKDEADALRILRLLSGQTHQVFTGVVVRDTATGHQQSQVVRTDVTFKRVPDEVIQAYVASGESFGKAGAYGIQSKGIIFLERLEGDYTNIVGLPMVTLIELLQQFEVKLF